MRASSEAEFTKTYQAEPAAGPGSGLDARSRMAVSVLASAATIALAAPEALLVLYAMSLIYALTMRNIRMLLSAYVVLLLMAGLAFACVRGLHALIPALPTVDFASMLAPFLRLAVMINVVLPLAFASRVQNLLNALQSLRLPFCLSLPATVMIRFIPTFAQDIRQVRDTMKLRGFRLSPQNCLLRPVLVFRFLFIPLLFRSLRSSEELGIAAEFKGMRADMARKRSRPYRAARWTRRDTLFVLAALAVAGIAALCQLSLTDIPPGRGGMGGMR